MLIAIKLLHTVIWAFLAASILALPVAGVLRRFRWAASLSVIVLLGVRRARCQWRQMPSVRFGSPIHRRASKQFRHLPPELAGDPQQSNLWVALRRQRIDGAVVLAEASAIIISQLRRHSVMHAVNAGVLYFALVFAVGFVLVAIRTLWVVPRIGTRTAELMEMPIMLVITFVAARWTVLRLSVPMMWSARLEMGCMALVLMLVAELGFVLWVRGLSIKEYFATRDPVSGAAYYLLLVVFAIMPRLV